MPHSLIVDNPYRVLGTSTAVSNQTLFSNYRSLMARSLKGIESSLGQDMTSFLEPPLRTPYRLDQAKLKLSSAKGRLFNSLFWFIDTNKIDHAALYYLAKDERAKTMKILMSSPSFSSYINLAVIALSEDRFKDAMGYYAKVFQDEAFTQEFVNAVLGEKYKINGVFILSKIAGVIDEAQHNKEREDNSDERSFAGSGYGVLNQESQNKIRLVNSNAAVLGVEHLRLRRQARKFDLHLSEAFDDLVTKIGQINHEYGVDDGSDFVEVELAVSPASKLVLIELQRFFDKNYALIEAFKNRCLEVREKSLYLDYVYNLASLVHYVYHLYIVDFGRMYSASLVQQMRSMTVKLERLYFRLKSDEIDELVASLKRVEDTLPFIQQISTSFEKYYSMQDPTSMVKNFYAFHAESLKALESFAQEYGLGGAYVDCSLHLQDMLVRFNVSFMSAMTGLAFQSTAQPKKLKNLVAVQRAIAQQEEAVQKAAAQNSAEQEAKDATANGDELSKQRELQRQAEKDQELPDLYTSVPRQPNQAPPVELVDKYGLESQDSEALPAGLDTDHGRVRGQLRNPIGNTWVQAVQAQGNVRIQGQLLNANGQVVVDPKKEQARLKALAKAQAQEQKRLEKIKRLEIQQASRTMRRRLTKERTRFLNLLKRFDSYSVSPSTKCLIRVIKQQVERLPPPVSLRAVGICLGLIVLAASVVYLDYWLNLK